MNQHAMWKYCIAHKWGRMYIYTEYVRTIYIYIYISKYIYIPIYAKNYLGVRYLKTEFLAEPRVKNGRCEKWTV